MAPVTNECRQDDPIAPSQPEYDFFLLTRSSRPASEPSGHLGRGTSTLEFIHPHSAAPHSDDPMSQVIVSVVAGTGAVGHGAAWKKLELKAVLAVARVLVLRRGLAWVEVGMKPSD